jgi:LAO/AO transport system kinase
LRDGLLAGDLRALARACTLVENQTQEGRQLLQDTFAETGRALTIGITGPPGAGKSTLVNRIATQLRAEGKRVGIIAVDPSSPFSQGAILGDRIRMQQHHADTGVFIRSMATRGQLGGLAAATVEVGLLLDAAGFDVVLIETVGVGQDEIEISRLADMTVLVLVPQMGDDVQAIKAGIMEIADVFAINKSDLPGAARLEQEIRAMQSLSATSGDVQHAPVCRVSAAEGQGIDQLLADVFRISERKQRVAEMAKTWEHRLRQMLRDRLSAAIPNAEIVRMSASVAQRQLDPFRAVDMLTAAVLKQS